ncbi:right-handed parallel beta-helix repeat-containing protein [Geoalkalibacter sp.]|uniref:right-handed parallel beta-helix repeat-containing protein n=1 Tax=Geoalkalibacter sp. TaxID=3041440 RepID=UPI00272E70F9|nr:right-handed parallel beta-helix repeat-containing protein [Geoalkalibacter sp.]
MRFPALILFLVLFAGLGEALGAPTLSVSTFAELKAALREARPGTVIEIAPGVYRGGLYLQEMHGTAEAPIVIRGADPENPPVFEGTGEGLKLSSCSYIHLSRLVFQGYLKNGINIDDDGRKGERSPSHHLVLEHLIVRDIGPTGNHDALKMSGVNHFVVRDCHFEGWGGSAIDLVGCRHGLIEGCRIIGREGYRTANGIQIKGGSRFILVQNSLLRDAGRRAVHIGGQTGVAFFRPEVEGFEARDVGIAGNTFVGGDAHIAWITAQESHVHHNLFYLPAKSVGRIAQETEDPRFAPSQKGWFENNLVVTGEEVPTWFHVGPGTAPDTFVFRGNAWIRAGVGIKPVLPVAETQGIYDLAVTIEMGEEALPLVRGTDERLRGLGPWSYTPWQSPGDFSDITLPPVVFPQP